MTQDFRRDRGSWRWKFEYHGQTYSKTGFKTQAQAEADERRMRRALSRGLVDEKGDELAPSPQELTLADYVNLWMGNHVKVNLRPRTARLYRQTLDQHVLPALGSRLLTQLTRSELRTHFASLVAGGLSKATISNAIIPLRSCLNAALDDGLITSNPATSLGRKIRAKTPEEAATVDAYSASELRTLLEDAPFAIETLARTGLRLGELLGLQPGDVEDDHLWVRRSIQWIDGDLHVLAPKSGKPRRVDIPPDLARRLKIASGSWCFGTNGDDPMHPEAIRKAWHEHLDTFWVVRRLRLHDLRHTYAALLLGRGAPLVYVKEQLGHSSIQVTADVYGHLIPGENRRWIDGV